MFYIKQGFLRTIKSVKKHKGLFLSLFFLQLMFIIAVSYVNVQYQVKLYENLQGIIGPLQEANYDAESIQAGEEFLKDMATVAKSYRLLKQNLVELGLWIAGLSLIFNGALWSLTHHLLHKQRFKHLAYLWLKYAIPLLLLLGLCSVAYYFIDLVFSMDLDLFVKSINWLIYFFLLEYYFLLVWSASINLQSWLEVAKRMFNLGVKKIHYVIPLLLINLVIIAGDVTLMYYLIIYLESFLWSALATLLLAFLLVATRIFWTASLQEVK